MLVPLLVFLSVAQAADKRCPWYSSFSSPSEQRFCLDFAFDYHYRLRHEETLKYKKQEMKRTAHTRDGALFLLAKARSEGGWLSTKAVENNNFWGLGGAYVRADGSSSFMAFPSFDEAFAYYMIHTDRGIRQDGQDDTNNPGWPKFLETMSMEQFTDQDVNKSLNSGNWCNKRPAYNVDQDKACKGQKGCPCINYAGEIRKFSLRLAISRCLHVVENAGPKTHAYSIVYKDKRPEHTPAERRALVYKEMKAYADEKCQEAGFPVIPTNEENLISDSL